MPDVYRARGYDFTGTAAFDRRNGYRSQSMLVVPMKDHGGCCIGALQLINAMNDAAAVVPFEEEDERLVSSLASQAAVALNRQQLVDGLETLLQSLVRLMATAIDDKSPYTGGHCRRVPELAKLLARAVNDASEVGFSSAKFTVEQLQAKEQGRGT